MRVGVLFGGRSAEHEISILSARYVAAMAAQRGHQVVLMAIDRWGRWWFDAMAERMLAEGPNVVPPPTRAITPSDRLPPWERLTEVDIVFPVLHGPFGEDGTVQGLLELAGVPYVGCGVTASAVAMDKAVAKSVFRAHGLPVLPYMVLSWADVARWPHATIADVEARLSYPVFVKPANLGSSVGISKVTCREALWPALAEAGKYDRKIIVEQGIEAREIEVSILGNDRPQASVPGEVIPGREWYDYQAKYEDKGTRLVIPAPLSEELALQVREMAVTAFRAIDGAGMARVDFLMDRRTGTVYINEVNTIPGFTPVSMYPKLWEASGMPGDELVDRLLHLGMERHGQSKNIEAHIVAETDQQPS